MINNPENLSKDRLKEELKRRGITFSPSKNKDYYVSLYKQNFTRSSRIRSEFSSDDEAFKRAPKTPSRDRRFTKVLNVDHYLRQLAPISDSELFNELKKHNIDAGPVTVSTRFVYERKLAKIMAENAKGGVSNSSSGITIASESDDDEFSSDNEEQTAQPTTITRQQPYKPTPQVQSVKQRIIHHSSSSDIQRSPGSYHLRSRPLPKELKQKHKIQVATPIKIISDDQDNDTNDDTSTSVDEFSRPYRASWCSVWVILQLVLLVVSFIAGLVIFDYLWNGDSRVVTLALGMINKQVQ